MRNTMLSWPQRGRLWLRLGIRAVLVAAAALLTVHVVLPSLDLLMPFLVALVVAWLLNPLVRLIQRKVSISRKTISLVLIILVCGAVMAALFGLLWMGFDQGRSLIENWSVIQEEMLSAVEEVIDWLREVGTWLPDGVVAAGRDVVDIFIQWVSGLDFGGWVADIAAQAPAVISAMAGGVIAVAVFLLASYFITGDYPRLRYWVADQLPVNVREFCGSFKRIAVAAFGGYIKSQVLLSLCVFVILTVSFFIIGQPYGLLLAAVFSVMDFIPIIGAGTVMVPWAVISLILGDWRRALELLVIWGIIALFRRMAEPKVLGDQTGLSPILSLAGIYVGFRLAGVLGMVLGPMLLLVLINVAKLGIFRPAADDIKLAAADISDLLKSDRPEGDDPSEPS